MDNERVREAVAEAQRFIKKAFTVLKEENESKHSYFGSASSGALRRSSLDLSRVLSHMRKP